MKCMECLVLMQISNLFIPFHIISYHIIHQDFLCHSLIGGTTVASPLPFRPGEPAPYISGIQPLVTPFSDVYLETRGFVRFMFSYACLL